MRTPDYFESMEIRFILSKEMVIRQCALTSVQASAALKRHGFNKTRFGASHISDLLATINGIGVTPPPYRGGVSVITVNRLAEFNPALRTSPTAMKAQRDHLRSPSEQNMFLDGEGSTHELL